MVPSIFTRDTEPLKSDHCGMIRLIKQNHFVDEYLVLDLYTRLVLSVC
jgi:hypothetical protein